jgi:hypothetical protein
MKTTISNSCPISGEKGNETVIRIIALLVVLVTSAALYFNNPFLLLFLCVDFFLRASKNEQLSVLRWNATFISNTLNLSNRPTDLAPKRFAAWIGFVFSLLLILLHFAELKLAFYIISSILVFCAFLESVFAFCVGCIVYQLIQRLKIA